MIGWRHRGAKEAAAKTTAAPTTAIAQPITARTNMMKAPDDSAQTNDLVLAVQASPLDIDVVEAGLPAQCA